MLPCGIREPDATCTVCAAPFINDHTPMGFDGVCMFCRPTVTVTCARCQVPCVGTFDGLKYCAGCRAEPLGAQQYADKQLALIEDLRARGLTEVPLAELLADFRARGLLVPTPPRTSKENPS